MCGANMILETLKTRRSCRDFKPEQINEADLEAILEAGMYAASGRGMQSPKFVVVQDPETREKLRAMNAAVFGKPDMDPFYGAPTIVVVLADSTMFTWVEDGSLAIGNMMIEAHALGLGSIWVHRAREEFDSEEGKELLAKWGIDEKYRGVGHCALGYANSVGEARPRKEDYVVRV